MGLMPSPTDRAEAMGHRVRFDPPATMTAAERWTCLDCGAAVIRYGANVYGSAVTNSCPAKSAAILAGLERDGILTIVKES